MELAKWKTNSEGVAAHLVENGAAMSLSGANTSGIFKVLGILWCSTTDNLEFSLAMVGERARSQEKLTKRFVLSFVASIYDPCGVLTPFTLRGRRLIQEMWSENLEWEQINSAKMGSELRLWASETETLSRFTVPRHYPDHLGKPTGYRLHVFGDASPFAYASSAYIEYCYPDKPSRFALVMCKSKVAPQESHRQSLPRLELMAALLSIRLKRFLTHRLEDTFDRVSFYTDSLVTYYWATSASTGRWKIFVANRVKEIQADSKLEEWYYVPGEFNVADLATRGISAETLVAARHWWSGPEWLRKPAHEQPTSRPRFQEGTLQLARAEMRQSVAVLTAAPPLLDLERYGTYGRALRVMAQILKFVDIAGGRQPTSFAELQRQAEVRLIIWTQRAHFDTEFRCASAGERVPSGSKLASFALFIDASGLLRARTRLTKSPLFTQDEKNPIVIPGESRLARLLIIEAHRVNAHFGVTNVLSQLRRRFRKTQRS
ncbi:uncharacterized protein LOC100901726 [Galendromus occidentalis]|uniref:Uncharacterized protein LOC100901726 n=1 Tax=Galendromus occidentalis TaxID=34638 RepID=A0AAJ6VXM8_9ACAR|nr:uncharacterized protein LOC100901726 [Galendromus occidentalis]